MGRTLKRSEPTTIRQKKKERQQRLRVELPTLDEDAQTVVTLARDLVEGLFLAKRNAPAIALLFGDEAASQLAGKAFQDLEDTPIVTGSISESKKVALEDAGVVIFVGPQEHQAPAIQRLADSVGTCPAVIVNPSWQEETGGDDLASRLLKSFEVCYSFMPLAIQGMFSKSEGAVFKFVRGGAPEGTPWLLFVMKNNKLEFATKLKRRPNSSELESVLYESMAANSPVSKSIQFLKGVIRR
eukprot:jgi/Mesen1/2865/ME000174S02112